MKKIEDYLPLYMGCECELQLIYNAGTMVEKLTGITQKKDGIVYCHFLGSSDSYRTAETVKPLLRPLSDMTEEEAGLLLSELREPQMFRDRQMSISERGFLLIHLGDSTVVEDLNANAWKFLIDKHFDLFGLIESGLAVSKTIKEQEDKRSAANTPNQGTGSL